MSDVRPVSKQAQKSLETRRRIREAARELFVREGYGATHLKDVAVRAGVAVQTIYFVFGNKRALLKELVDTTIAGNDEDIATMNQPWYVDALAADTAPAMLRAYVAGSASALQRFAGIIRMVEAAKASDPDIAALLPQGVDTRYSVNQKAAEALTAKPEARKDISVQEAADLLYGLTSPHLYLLFVDERGWSRQRFEQWVTRTLTAQLCATGGQS